MAPTAIAASDTLTLWEQADGLPPVRRALALAAYAGVAEEELARRPVGAAYAPLLDLRARLTTAALESTASCPRCAARAEFTLDPDVLLGLHREAGRAVTVVPEPVLTWRPPTPEDLIELIDDPDPAAGLLRRCVRVADGDPADLPAELLEVVEEAMIAADPLAEVRVSLRCPECEHELDCAVDLGDFVWAELDARARRLLHEVDVLARAYGWTEPEVLALSETRRAAYLRLVMDGAP